LTKKERGFIMKTSDKRPAKSDGEKQPAKGDGEKKPTKFAYVDFIRPVITEEYTGQQYRQYGTSRVYRTFEVQLRLPDGATFLLTAEPRELLTYRGFQGRVLEHTATVFRHSPAGGIGPEADANWLDFVAGKIAKGLPARKETE
jgi:hypothetical protein